MELMPWFLLRALQRTARIFVLRFAARLDQLGIVLDPEANSRIHAQEAVISAAYSKVKVMVIPTNEELVVAREVRRFLENKKNNLTESKQSYLWHIKQSDYWKPAVSWPWWRERTRC